MKKILIVEDEKALAEEISEILQMEGYDVLFAENGKIGIEMAKQYLPDLILCDIMMPVMDGIRVIYELKAHEKTTLIPFVFMSAIAERQSVRSGMELGADDYLIKPFTHKELLYAIDIRLKKQEAMKLHLDQTIDALRNQIMTMLPHELRTPLSSVIGFGSLLSEMADRFTVDEISGMGKDILDAGNKLLRLTENYLIYVQLRLNEKTNHLVTEVAVESVFYEITEQLSKVYKRNAPTDILLDPVDLLSVSESFFRKIFFEIIDNAYKFSSSDSKVEVRGKAEGEMYSITVADNGCGMNPAYVSEIGAFVQFDRAKNEQQGHGLGLAIASKMVDLSGGKFQINSKEGIGTDVTILFARG